MKLCILLCLLCTCSALAQQTPFASSKRILTPEFSEYAERVIKDEGIPGYSLAVVRRDGGIELGAWGNMTEDGRPTTPDTLQYIGSCSKAFTATAMGLLISDFAQGRNTTSLPPGLSTFSWDTKVADLLPGEWALQDEWASRKASVKDIMAHVSGLPRHDFSYGSNETVGDAVKGLRDLTPQWELRERWNYNNIMYLTAAHIITKYTGSYASYVTSRIFEPLNMTSTTFSYASAASSGHLPDAFTHSGGEGFRRIPYLFDTEAKEVFIAGAGGVISNVVDMAKWIQIILNKGVNPHTNQAVIPESVLNQITSAHFVVPSDSPEKKSLGPELPIVAYGAGWARTEALGRPAIAHGGGLPGFTTQVSLFPGEGDLGGVGFVGLLNADGAAMAHIKMENKVYIDVFGLGGSSAFEGFARVLSTERPSDRMRSRSLNSAVNSELDLSEFTGTYSSPGYGTFTLCAPSSTSSYCDQASSDFSAFPARNQLIGIFPRFWTSHISLSPISNDTLEFAVDFSTLYPKGYGSDKTPFVASMGLVYARFVKSEGGVDGFELRAEADWVDAFFTKNN